MVYRPYRFRLLGCGPHRDHPFDGARQGNLRHAPGTHGVQTPAEMRFRSLALARSNGLHGVTLTGPGVQGPQQARQRSNGLHRAKQWFTGNEAMVYHTALWITREAIVSPVDNSAAAASDLRSNGLPARACFPRCERSNGLRVREAMVYACRAFLQVKR